MKNTKKTSQAPKGSKAKKTPSTGGKKMTKLKKDVLKSIKGGRNDNAATVINSRRA